MLHVREVHTVTRGIELARQPVQSGTDEGYVFYLTKLLNLKERGS